MLKKTLSVDNIAASCKKSNLTRKPARLKASDFNTSSVQVFLEDGSSRTLWYSPTTTCRNLVCKAVEKSKRKERIDVDQYQLQVRLNSGQILLPNERDLVANIVGLGLDKVFIVKSSSCPSTARNNKLTKTVSMQKIAYNFGGNSVQEKSKRTSKLLKLKLFHKSETNLVISAPIPDSEFNDLMHCHRDPDKEYFYNKYQCSKPRGLYRLDRKKSLSTGHLFALTSDESQATESMQNSIASSPQGYSQTVFPEVPKRTCSFLENCTTDDQYLIKQGESLQHDSAPRPQRWSDPAQVKVGDIEPDYDSLLAMADKDPVYDIPIAACSSKNTDNKTTSNNKATSPYVNCNISTDNEKVFFSGGQVHMYDTPRPSTHVVDLTKDTGIETDTAASPNSVEMFDDDYVNMFEEVHDAILPKVQKISAKPLPPLPPEPSPTERTTSDKSHLRASVQPRYRPWSSHLTDAAPALPPRPLSLTRDKLLVEQKGELEKFKPPLLAPCNSFDESVTKMGRLSFSTSSPCLCPELQHGEEDLDDPLYDSPPLTPYADEPKRKPSKLPASLSNPNLSLKEDMTSLNRLLRDLSELALTYN